MKKVLVLILVLLSHIHMVIIGANAETVEKNIYQHDDLFWYIEDSHAVICGNIYDETFMTESVPEQIVIPEMIQGYPVEAIDGFAFERYAPGRIILPDGLLELRSSAFSECCVELIEIPASVILIEDTAFDCCSYLQEIKVHHENRHYQAIDGCLYSKDGQDFICCPSQKTGVLELSPQTVKIHTDAFLESHVSEIVFPESVVEIMPGAVASCYDLLSVTLGSNISYIGDLAFNSNSTETTFYFMGDPPSIGEYAFTYGVTIHFNYQSSKESTYIYIGDADFKQYLAILDAGVSFPVGWFPHVKNEHAAVFQFKDIFWYAENDHAVIVGSIYDQNMSSAENAGVTRMVIPAEIDGFPVKVFDGHFDMWSPREVILPEGLTTIRTYAFDDSPIVELTIPSTVTQIEPGAIRYCDELEKINVSPGNENYVSIGGILYTSDGKELLCCPPMIETDNGTLIVPGGTEIVQSYAFTTCYSIDTLIFQEGLIGLEDFAMTEGVFQAVHFPASLKYMGDYAFCSIHCKSVYFDADLPVLGEDVFSASYGTMVYIGNNEGILAVELNSVGDSPIKPDDSPNDQTEPALTEKPDSTETPDPAEKPDLPEKPDPTGKKQALIVLIPVLVLGIVSVMFCRYKRKRNR